MFPGGPRKVVFPLGADIRTDAKNRLRRRAIFTSRIMSLSTGMSSNSPRHAWQALYHAALFENDRSKVPLRIEEAEKAIVSRIRELFVTTTDHIEEDVVLDDALYALRALRSCAHSDVAAA